MASITLAVDNASLTACIFFKEKLETYFNEIKMIMKLPPHENLSPVTADMMIFQ